MKSRDREASFGIVGREGHRAKDTEEHRLRSDRERELLMPHSGLPPFTLGRIAASIAVTDIDRSESFFRTFLGLTPVFTNGTPTGFVILQSGAAELHLNLVKEFRAGRHNVAHLLIDDAGAVYQVMDAAGVRIVKGLRDADYGLRGFVFSDPDGNRIDVGQHLPSEKSNLPIP